MLLGVLTGGGDVPGLNPCIKAFVNRVTAAGHEVLGIRRGWGGLLHFDPDDPEGSAEHLEPLDPASVRTIDRTGGTVLHTSRTNPGGVRAHEVPAFLAGAAQGEGPFDFTPHVLRAIGASDDLAQSSIRFGLGRFNTVEEVDLVVERVVGEVHRLRALSPAYVAAKRAGAGTAAPRPA